MTMTKHEFDLRRGQPIFRNGRYLYGDGWQAKWDADGSGRFKEPPFDDDELEALRQEYRDTVLAQQMERIRSRGESFEDFARRQGCPYRMVKGRALFKNGAQHAGPGNYDWGTEPPRERFARLRLQEQFLRDALAEEERAFNAFRKYAAEAAANATRFYNCNPRRQTARDSWRPAAGACWSCGVSWPTCWSSWDRAQTLRPCARHKRCMQSSGVTSKLNTARSWPSKSRRSADETLPADRIELQRPDEA